VARLDFSADHAIGRSGPLFLITPAGRPNFFAVVFRARAAAAYRFARVTAPRCADPGFSLSFWRARFRLLRDASVPPVIRGSARLIRGRLPIGFRSRPPVPFSRASCVARLFPAAVRSLPPLAVAPCPPTLVIRPALSRVRRFVPRLTIRAASWRPVPTLPVLENRPRLSRRYVRAMAVQRCHHGSGPA